jgi:hypothetical protein
MPKICVGVPTNGLIKAKTALSIVETIRLNDYDFLPYFHHGLYLSENREKTVEVAKNNNCTHLWFIDWDVVFGHTALPLLLANDKDIISAIVNYRRLPLEPQTKFFPETKEIPDQTFKVAGIAGSMMLIKMTVFDKLKPPYFPLIFDENGHVEVSEDLGFCLKAREAGFDIWADPSIEIKHYGDFGY